MLNNIKAYSDSAFGVFPCSNKRPTDKGVNWRLSQPDTDPTENRYPDQFGVVIPQGILVLDIDLSKMSNDDVWIRFKNDHPGLLDTIKTTFCVKTPSGGWHIYLRTDGRPLRKNLKKYPFIDFLTQGAYVIGAGSPGPDDKTYLIKHGGPDTITDCPLNVQNTLEYSENTERDTQPLPTEDTPALRELLRSSLPLEHPARGCRNNVYFVYACRGHDLGLTPEATYGVLSTYNMMSPDPEDDELLRAACANAYRYAKNPVGISRPGREFESAPCADTEREPTRYDTTKAGAPQKTLRNCLNFMVAQGYHAMFRRNMFTGDMDFMPEAQVPWKRTTHSLAVNDDDCLQIRRRLAVEQNIDFSTDLVWAAIALSAADNQYHPVQDWLRSLKWDGEDRLSGWLTKYCGVESTPYSKAIGLKTLVAACARVFNPGVQWDHVLILEGDQGIGKSSVVRILGKPWAADVSIDPHARDTIDAIRGKWFIELSELDVLKRHEMAAMKGFISRVTDRARLAYARASVDFARQCVFIGTINPEIDGYLQDTQNRRFWPVLCSKIDMKGLAEDRDQLMAQAYAKYKKGEDLWLSDDSVAEEAIGEQELRKADDAWDDAIQQWGFGCTEQYYTIMDAYTQALRGDIRLITKSEQVRIGKILVKYGWKKVSVRYRGLKHPVKRLQNPNYNYMGQETAEAIEAL